MKWTEQQITELHALCHENVPNSELAKHFNVPVTEIHAKRSQLGITIPKIKTAQGKPGMTINPVFEAAVQEMEKELPSRKTGLAPDVKKAFAKLKDEILLAIAGNHTSLDKGRAYGYLHCTICSIEKAFDTEMRSEA